MNKNELYRMLELPKEVIKKLNCYEKNRTYCSKYGRK